MDANELMFISIIVSLKLQPQKFFPLEGSTRLKKTFPLECYYKTRAHQDSISRTFTRFSRQNNFHSLAQIIFLISFKLKVTLHSTLELIC